MTVSFRQAEYTLYHFPVNLMRWQEAALALHDLRHETDCRAQSYEGIHASEGTHSEPVASYYALIEASENTLKHLAKKTIPVMRLRNFLKNSQDERYRVMYYVMELRYFEQWELKAVAEHLRKSTKTISRRRQELIDLTIDELERGVFDYEFGNNSAQGSQRRSSGNLVRIDADGAGGKIQHCSGSIEAGS